MKDFLYIWCVHVELDFCIFLAFLGSLVSFTAVLGMLAFLGSNYALLFCIPFFLGGFIVFLGVYPFVVYLRR